MASVVCDRKNEIHTTRDNNNVRSVMRNVIILRRAIQKKKAWNADIRCTTSSWHCSFFIQMLALEHCCSISTGTSFTTLLTAFLSLRATAACLSIRRTGCYHSAWTEMSWWKVSKHGRAHRRQTSLTYAYKCLFSDTTSASTPTVTTLRSRLNM
jgi:hypothetical protein